MDVCGIELDACLSGRQTKKKLVQLFWLFDLLNDCWIQEIHTTSGCSDSVLVEWAMYWYIVPGTEKKKRVLNHCAVKGENDVFLEVYALYF